MQIAPLQEDGRRVGHFLHALVGHGEHAQLVDGAEAVLHPAQGPVAAGCRRVEHHEAVDHVLEHFWSCQVAFLGDVTNQHDDGARLLGEPGEEGGRLPDLSDAARCAFHRLQLHHLNGVENDHLRLDVSMRPATASARVSEATCRRSMGSDSRDARSASCCRDSSPVT